MMTMDTIGTIWIALLTILGMLTVAHLRQGDYARRLAERNAAQAATIAAQERLIAKIRAESRAVALIQGRPASSAGRDLDALYGASTGKMEGEHEKAYQAGYASVADNGVARTISRDVRAAQHDPFKLSTAASLDRHAAGSPSAQTPWRP